MFDFLKGKKPMTNFEYDIISNTNQSGFFPQNDEADVENEISENAGESEYEESDEDEE